MQLKVIESFVCLYQEKNFSKASEKLYISQQGLSRQIQAFESELDVILFNRSNTGVEPTEICKSLYPHIKNMYDEYQKAQATLKDYKKTKRHFYTVAFAYGITNSVSSDFMFDYQKQHPKVNLEIEEWSQETCIQKLIKKEIDAAFLVTPLDQKVIKCFTLIEGEMIIAMHKSHPLAKSDTPLEFSALDGENLITGVPENAIRRMMDYFCLKTGVHLRVIISSSNNLNFINSMTENIGIASLTQTMAARVTNPEIFLRRVIMPERGFLYFCVPKNAEKCSELADIQKYVENYFKTTPIGDFLKPSSVSSARNIIALNQQGIGLSII
ncbi:MAG: LysR family transcriptional regulator [Oscillospiraceae bacterium]|nr:LysR family transcriptional regulator [Oscillospiraceae bacterium]